MTRTFEVLYKLTDYYGLAVEYSDDLPLKCAGCLDPSPDPRYILVNRNLPAFEQAFTIAHELGHYLRHHGKPNRSYVAWPWNRDWQIEPFARFSKLVRRTFPRIFTREWEADLWALSTLFTIGARDVLRPYIEHHPDKLKLCLLVAIISVPINVRNRFRAVFRSVAANLG